MEFVKLGPWQMLLSGGLLLGIAFACGRAGLCFFSFWPLGLDRWTQGERRLFSLGLGLIFLSLGTLVLGLLGFLNAGCAAALVLLFYITGFRTPSAKAYDLGRSEGPPLQFILCIFIALALFLSWSQTFVPPIENDGIAYHLVYPKEYVSSGMIRYLPHTLASLWPAQTEMLFTLGLLFQGTALAKAFHWIFYVLTAFAVHSMVSRFYNRKAALYAMATFVFIPAAFVQSSQSYVDLTLAFFIFLAVYAFVLKEEIGEMNAAWLSGIFCGGALATKYLALGFAAILGLGWITRSKDRWRTTLCFSLGAIAVAGIWYVRSWAILGNPLYPFFPNFFGGHGYPIRIIDGMGKDIVSFIFLVWNMTLHPGPFGGEWLGPLCLIFLPFLLLGIKGAKPVSRTLSAFALLGTLFIFTQSQQVRYLLAIAPIYCVGVGVALDNLTKKNNWLRRVSLTVFIAVLFLHGALFIYRTRNAWSALSGTMNPVDYLLENERSFKGYQYLNGHVKPGEEVFNFSEVRRFYQGKYLMVLDMPALRIELEKKGLALADYVARERFHYLWTNPSVLSGGLGSWIRLHYDEAFSYDFTEAPATFHYSIYHLREPASRAV